MKKLAITLAATALVLGSALSVNAQTQQPGSLHALTQNATPLVPAACGGHWGRHCPPGKHWVCGRWHCWCAWC